MMTIEKLVSKKKIASFLSKLSSENSIDVSGLIISQFDQILQEEKFDQNSYYSAQAVLDFIWEKLNTGHWSNVDIIWRQLFTIISVIKVLIVLDIIKDKNSDNDHDNNFIMRDVVKICDIGLLMGAPVLDNICSQLASFFCQKVQMIENINLSNGKLNPR